MKVAPATGNLHLECQRRVNWLVFGALKRKASTSTDSTDSIGRAVITRTLRRAGISTGYVTVGDLLPRDSVLLISLTSSFDVAAVTSSGLPEIHRSRPDVTIIVGGPGMQNPWAVRSFADYAFLGRGENSVVGIVDACLNCRDPSHPSLIRISDMNSAVYAQATDLIDEPVRLCSVKRYWVEDFVGCPHLCAYCHYSFAHQYRARRRGLTYEQSSLTPQQPEIRLSDIPHVTSRRIRTSIDGCSERLRLAVGKRITDNDIVNAIDAMAERGATFLHVYNIGNMPGETEDDRLSLDSALLRASRCTLRRGSKRLNVLVQTTPFRPSPLTPLAIAPASLWPNWHDCASRKIAESESVLAVHSYGNESPKSHLVSLAVERHCGNAKAQETLDICASRRFQSAATRDAIEMIDPSEVARLCRGYEWDDLPTRLWTSWVKQSAVAARSLRLRAAMGW